MYDAKLITVGNYLRVIAAVIMRGLVLAKNDETFFRTETRGSYTRTGAKDVVGISLFEYQQLIRYLHLARTSRRPATETTEHDKCYFVRPLIKLLQRSFSRWFVPGKNNAVDEAGVPSRMRWLRNFNKDKPHKYYIELLMACCSITRFCWHFFVNESAQKIILNPRRRQDRRSRRSRAKFRKVTHYQPEFNGPERELQDKIGVTSAQIVHFARKLRATAEDDVSLDDGGIIYRVFVDRRWDSLAGIVEARRKYAVSYTATVMSTHRFHVIESNKKINKLGLQSFVKKSKLRINRGKYRAATTKVGSDDNEVTLVEVLWNDSSLVGCVSADLGSEECSAERRMGRWKVPISCPKMMVVRGKYFRAVDQNDQLRLSKWAFQFMCKKKAWLKLFFALIELLLVNIYIVAIQTNNDLTQDDFRWAMVMQLVAKAKEVDEENEIAERTRSARRREAPLSMSTTTYSRFSGGLQHHHHDTIHEYVSAEQAEINQAIVNRHPAYRQSNKLTWRDRDSSRKNGKVRNPMYTSLSNCLVCKYVHNKVQQTAKYCRECTWQSRWPKTIRAKGYQLKLHPRLCSQECFDYFHTYRIPDLDNPPSSRKKRRRNNRSRRTTQDRVTTPNHQVRTNRTRRRLDVNVVDTPEV